MRWRSWTTSRAGGIRTCPRPRPSTSWTSARGARRHPRLPHTSRRMLIAECSSQNAHRRMLIAECSSQNAYRRMLIAECLYFARDNPQAKGPAETRALAARELAAREVDDEGGPFAQAALHGNPTAVVLGYVLDDGEPQSSPARRLGARLVHAIEAFEDARQLGLGDADAGVGDPNHDLRTLKAARHLHPPARRGVVHGVIH